jgi:hypothetical protein
MIILARGLFMLSIIYNNCKKNVLISIKIICIVLCIFSFNISQQLQAHLTKLGEEMAAQGKLVNTHMFDFIDLDEPILKESSDM